MRTGARQMLGIKAAEDMTGHGLSFLAGQSKGLTIGGYMPIGDEIDARLLMSELARRGFHLALPAVVANKQALTFRRWGFGDPLVDGAFNTQEPEVAAPECVPDILLVPLLAFNMDCYRLGYGGGFYDRTLAKYPHLKAFGLAYGAQYMDNLIVSEHDWPLQGIITETGVIVPRGR